MNSDASESTVHAERCGDENQGVHPVLEDTYLLGYRDLSWKEVVWAIGRLI